MKIATKTLVTLLIVSTIMLSSGSVSAVSGTSEVRRNNKLERLQKHHDRKLELRASVLEITPQQLKQELKDSSFDQVLKKHGFKDRAAFQTALDGKVKDELKRRGWGEDKINKYLQKRADRLLNNS